MTIEETKEWLRRAWYIDIRINSMLRDYWAERDRLTKVTASLTGMPGSPSKDPHKMENGMDKLAEIGERIDRKVYELRTAKEEIRDAIISLDDPRQQEILSLYYLTDENGRHKTFEQIGAFMHYSEKQIRRFHSDALKILSETIRCP